ncbi:endoplasmic reticulum metallopeptidase 1-like [Acyrthosiphon pisum]|uniref:FXNA-like protease n=1 Tax=Acyrthosiphon pisum TaxID=7029 RepID=A0A8R2H7D5_ACYPI|nr:endoplasmic reticulum metallopeptidase 1-like [Acyrthosiphon pisum]|eukprot:XP_016659221.1 PREDICTED: endoplasmic reticulum metallopeptidase 1-like [Acyrthosiphon pisum]
MELRHRGNRSDNNQQMETFQIDEKSSDTKDEAIRNQKCLSAVPTLLISLTVLIILNVFVYYMDNKLPPTESNNSTSNDFVAKRAMSTLIKLANLGPRPVGSYENEKLAFNLLKTEINDIRNEVGNVNEIEMYNQKVSGSFILNMKNWKYLLSYEDLQNIVVKIDPKQGINDAILLNCHYDTVPAGPGVSDNGVNCAVMVELLRILAKTPHLRRPIIFLFNGGEEIMLQASHGFVTQHPWSKSTKHVINLDSCGAGGREILFQTTKSDSYLVDLYARTVPHPYGQVIGEELFQSGIIPSDTDFRIFRDFGNMSGLDLAHYKNGYVYHTKYDNLDQIEPSVLQNTGENLFALAKAMSTQNVTNSTKSKYVFFDVFGVYMFSYTELSGAFANFIIVLLSFFSIFLSLKFTTVGMNRREYSLHLLTAIVSPGCTIVTAVLTCLLVAFALDRLGCSMSWYSNWTNLLVYFGSATWSILTVAAYYPKIRSRTDAEWTVTMLNGVQLFWTALLFVTTMAGLRSSYLFAVMVLWPSAASCTLGIMNAGRTPAFWIAGYAASLFVPVAFVLYLTQMFASLFVPISGRLGPNVNPDYVVGTLMAMSAYATVGHLAPAIALVNRPRPALAGLGATVLLTAVAIVAVRPVGFPYSSAKTEQRLDLIHTQRMFHDFGGGVRYNDSGYLIVNWDRQGPRTVANYAPNAARIDCTSELMCGSPVTGSLAYHTGWLPGQPAPAAQRSAATAQVVVLKDDERRRRIVFNVTGPERVNVYVSPYPGTRLKSWSFVGEPEVATNWMGNDVYVIKHSSGAGPTAGDSQNMWSFWLEHECDRGFGEMSINVTLAYSWVIHKDLVLGDEFRSFVDSFPRWAHVNIAVASVEAFVY